MKTVPARMTPNDKLLKIIHDSRGTDLNNKLMRITDRELALSMMYMEQRDREAIFDLLSTGKVKRIREELSLHDRLQIRYAHYRTAIDHVIQILNHEKKSYSLKSYLKPRHYRR